MSWRAVLDTNVSISGLLFGGVPAEVVAAGARKRFTLITSDKLLVELETKLVSKLQKPREEVNRLLGIIRRTSESTTPDELIILCRDPKDNHVLECAISGEADVIVTGDKDLLVLDPFRGIRILTPRQFLDRLESGATP